MSDMMGMPQPNTDDVMREQRSLLNPADAAAMAQEGGMSPEMSVRDMLAQFGIDVDGPAIQLRSFVASQVEKADPNKKMQALARSTPPPNPMQGAMQQPMPPGGGGGMDPLEALMGRGGM